MELAILAYLSERAATGETLKETLGGDPDAFKAATRQMWLDGLLQGQLADGCCSAPCGTMCVSAMKPAMVWQLSKKGRLRIKLLEAKGAWPPSL